MIFTSDGTRVYLTMVGQEKTLLCEASRELLLPTLVASNIAKAMNKMFGPS